MSCCVFPFIDDYLSFSWNLFTSIEESIKELALEVGFKNISNIGHLYFVNTFIARIVCWIQSYSM